MHRFCFLLLVLLFIQAVHAQSSNPLWIWPQTAKDAPVWGIKNGSTMSLWPAAAELTKSDGGPRGLLRIGYNYLGTDFLINFIAIEPFVEGDMEFSEISLSTVDGKWGKFIWAADSTRSSHYTGTANVRGAITHPDSLHPEVEALYFYLLMEPFKNGAHPYLKVNLRDDEPGEVSLQIFNEDNSAKMERCALTATMGTYSRLRLLYVKNSVVDAKQLFAGYNDIDFVEKQPYPYRQMMRTKRVII